MTDRPKTFVQLSEASDGVRRAEGGDLSLSISHFVNGQMAITRADESGEAVAAILEGDFRVCAAGEEYELTVGEAIIIPAGEPQAWRCLTERGVLYQVATRAKNAATS